MATFANPDDLATWARELGFSVTLLDLNRRGAVDPSQLAWFRTELIRDVLVSVVVLAAAVATAFFVKPWWRWLACLLQLAMVGFFVREGIQSVRDRLHPQVLSAQGKPAYSAGARQSYRIKIGTHEFPVAGGPRDEDRMQKLLDPRTTYRLYYLRHTGRPLTIEPVPD